MISLAGRARRKFNQNNKATSPVRKFKVGDEKRFFPNCIVVDTHLVTLSKNNLRLEEIVLRHHQFLLRNFCTTVFKKNGLIITTQII